MTVDREQVTHRVDAEHLELGGGLEVLLAAALERVAPGGVLEIRTPSRAVALELPGWARLAGMSRSTRPAVRTGTWSRSAAAPRPGSWPGRSPAERAPSLRHGALHTADWRGGAPPPSPILGAGFAPLGAVPETGAPTHHWRLSRPRRDLGRRRRRARRTGVRPAVGRIPRHPLGGGPRTGRHNRTRCRAGHDVPGPERVRRAVRAGRVPPQVNPQLVELVLWLGSHVHDEARHIEVFTKRSLAGGHHGYALASTELSLSTLLDEHDFTASSLLLNVLGEGTFLDLLRFIEIHAPDAATAAAARLAHRDERRHVHFGISNIKRSVSINPDAMGPLVTAAETRAAKLISLSGLSPVLVEALTIMTARSLQPADLSDAAADVRALMQTMERNRLRRLQACGFDTATARHLSDLHTPNLM